MASDNQVDIDVRVTGDASGAQEVERGLEGIEDQAGKTGDAVGDRGLAGQTDKADQKSRRLKGTLEEVKREQADFSRATKGSNQALDRGSRGAGRLQGALNGISGRARKARQSLDEMGGPLNELIDKGNVIGGAVLGSIALVVTEFVKWRKETTAMQVEAAKALPEIESQVASVAEAESELVNQAEAAATAMEKQADASDRVVEGIRQQTEDTKALMEARKELNLARIEEQRATGQITEEEAAKQSARVSREAAEGGFEAETEAAAKIAQERQKQIEATQAALAEVRRQEAQAEARQQELESAPGRKSVAREVAPEAQAELEDLRRIVRALEQEQEQLKSEQGPLGISMREKDAPFLEQVTGKAAVRTAERTVEIKDRLTVLEQELATAREQLAAAEQERADAVTGEVETARETQQAVKEKRKELEAALAEQARLLQEANEQLRRRQEGGVEREIFETRQDAERTRTGGGANGPSPSPSGQSAADAIGGALDPLSDTSAGPQVEALRRLIADGVQERDRRMIRDLTTALASELRNAPPATQNAVAELRREVRRHAEQLADLNTES